MPIIASNIFVLGSPWESDVVVVTPRLYWHEYEIKVSLADYRADFQKRISTYSSGKPLKHDCYASSSPIRRPFTGAYDSGRQIPKPATFSFVVPKGMLDGVEVPPHCGIIECDTECKRSFGITVVRKAPRLKKPTQLDTDTLFNIGTKLSWKARPKP